MKLRAVLAMSVIAGVTVLVAPASVDARSTPRCHGKVATIVVTGSGPVLGTEGDDVIVGSSGADEINATQGGVDFVCGGSGNDTIQVQWSGSWADGGNGNDHVEAWRGATALGGSGDDEVWGLYYGSSASGGSGNDFVYIEEGWGDGGSGNDEVRGWFAVEMLGGSGRDFLVDNIGSNSQLMDCGSNADTYVIGSPGGQVVRRCEVQGV